MQDSLFRALGARFRVPDRWRSRAMLLVLLLAALSAYRAMRLPGLVGFLNDDGLYALFAKALVTGQGYISLQWPEHPPAIRYPIGWPAILAIAMAGTADPAVWTERIQWAGAVVGTCFAGLSYAYLRRHLGPAPALAAAAAVAFGAKTIMLGSHVMSDLAFGTVALGALLIVEPAVERDEPGWRPALLGGLLCGSAFLFRYAGISLVAAVAICLLARRKWPALAAFSLGSGAIVLPWLGYRAVAGGHYYFAEFANAVGPNPLAGLLDQARFLSANALPGLLAAPLLGARSWPLAAAGVLISGLVVLGAVRWVATSRARLGPLLLALTAAAALAWGTGFPELEEAFLARMLVPVAPIVMVCLARLLARPGEVPAGARALPAYALSLALAAWQFAADLRVHRAEILPFLAQAEYQRLFAFIRDELPPDARLLDWHGPMFSFYTGRTCYSFPNDVSIETFGTVLEAVRPDYVVVTPRWDPETGTGGYTLRLVDAFGRAHPGTLRIAYANADRTMGIMRVTKPLR